MTSEVYVYRCLNTNCRKIEKFGGPRFIHKNCSTCGKTMILIGTEKIDNEGKTKYSGSSY